MKIVHLTSVHSPRDARIFGKECRSLAATGAEVVLVAPSDRNERIDGVRIRSVPRAASRLERWTRTIAAVFRAAWVERGDVYHFHDPELIPVGLLLRLRGAPVIYDVHEDYVTSVRQKRYIPALARPVLARALDVGERCAASAFEIVIAEKYYAERFPQSTPVLNYPLLDGKAGTGGLFAPVPRLLYTGSISVDRGALIYAQLLERLPDFEIHLVGRIGGHLLRRIKDEAGPAAERLVVPFVDRFVPPAEILQYCNGGKWLGGLAIFPRTPHYARKELTKFFEYMALGIPTIASDFPAWLDLLRDSGGGVGVAPEDPDGAARAIIELLRSPQTGAELGRAARAAVFAQYDWTSQAARLVRVYDRLDVANHLS